MPDSQDPTQHFPTPDGSGDGWVLGNRYRVIGRIGAGGMAEVFRARDQMLDREVAIKVFRSAASADTAAGADRQRAEIHALARLNHPNLITLYDGSIPGPGDGDSRAYLVMELVEGPNLGDRIEQGPPPSEAEVRVIGTQVADALAYVHGQGMVHRDVKPANILLGAGTGSDQVRARLSDFGIVRLVGAEQLTQADSTLGTASYLAPEQARGSQVGPPADVYALGLTLIEALTGVRSFDAATPLEAVLARLDRDPAIPQQVVEPWPTLLAAMTARDPARRPNARQVANALRGGTTTSIIAPVGATAATTAIPSVLPSVAPLPVGDPAGTGYRPAVMPDRSPAPKPRNTGLIVGLVLAAVVILLGAIIVIATTSGGGGNGDTTTVPSTGSSGSTSASRSPTSGSPTTSEGSSSTEPSAAPETTVTRTRTTTSEAPSTSQQTSQSVSQTASRTAASSASSSPAADGPGLSSGSATP